MNCPQCHQHPFSLQQPCTHCGYTAPPETHLSHEITLDSLNTGKSSIRRHVRPQVLTPSLSLSSRSFSMQPVILTEEMSLQNNHYQLVERQDVQKRQDICEVRWLAQDIEKGSMVMLHEISLSGSNTQLQLFLRSVTKTLMTSGNEGHTPQLLDVFMEYGRGFFVVEAVNETLYTQFQQGILLPEADAINCYRHIAEHLAFFAQQQPSMSYGLVHPSQIFLRGNRWRLTHGSLLSMGRTHHPLAQHHSDQTSDHFNTTGSSDLFTLAQIIYYAVTGSNIFPDSRSLHAQLTKAHLSPAFTAILLKGLHPQVQERFHHPHEIIRALGGGHDGKRIEDNPVRRAISQESPKASTSFPPLRELPPNPVASPPRSELIGKQKHQSILPDPDTLAPMPQRADTRSAIIWSAGFLLCESLILLIAR